MGIILEELFRLQYRNNFNRVSINFINGCISPTQSASFCKGCMVSSYNRLC